MGTNSLATVVGSMIAVTQPLYHGYTAAIGKGGGGYFPLPARMKYRSLLAYTYHF